MFEDIPEGTAIIEGSPYAGLLGGTGVNLYNYLWTFKTVDQIVTERIKASTGWNKFKGFTEIYKHVKDIDENSVRAEVIRQIKAVREKATRFIQIEDQPELMLRPLTDRLKENMIGHPDWRP
jgi:hypothetical protein